VSFGLILSLALSFVMARRITRGMDVIKRGLNRMKHDLRKPIRPLAGEMGEIGAAVNEMARALLDARSLNENILWSIADGVITVDVNGDVTSINPAGQEIMGLHPEDVIGRPYDSLLDRDAVFTSYLLDTLRNGNEYVSVSVDVPLQERSLQVSTSTSLLRDGSGKVIGAVAVFKDISETRQLQKQVLRADRLAALGELVAGIAHDIRNPLTSIRGFVQYLQKSQDPQELREYGPLIIRQVDGLNRTIGELLNFAKPHPPLYGPAQVNDLIREMTQLIWNRAEKQGIGIEIRLDPVLPTIRADGEQLKQVLLNLLINAIQAVTPGGRIVLATARTAPGRVVITVADNGSGIPPEHLEKVFDPFFSTKPGGTGLGLAVVQRIIGAHGGEVSIDSEAGKGTTVTIRLPEAPAESGE
jgi:two-component system sensor histidine kinase AtoS